MLTKSFFASTDFRHCPVSLRATSTPILMSKNFLRIFYWRYTPYSMCACCRGNGTSDLLTITASHFCCHLITHAQQTTPASHPVSRQGWLLCAVETDGVEFSAIYARPSAVKEITRAKGGGYGNMRQSSSTTSKRCTTSTLQPITLITVYHQGGGHH